MKVLFYVQHLLGIGHLARASRIADAFVAAGDDVTLVSGGMPVPGFPAQGVKLEQLEPVRASGVSFSCLVDAKGEHVAHDWHVGRSRQLIETFDRIRPDCLLIEAFPFGRRQVRHELMEMLRDVRSNAPKTLVLSSIRDILQPRIPEKDQKTKDVLFEWFDGVLVHGDPQFVTLDETFAEAPAIEDITHYTNMVAPGPVAKPVSDYDVVVSAGGGIAGLELLQVAIAAREHSSLANDRWLILCGTNLPEADFERLHGGLPANVSLQRHRPDLPAILAGARLSISQAGYNTVGDILSAGCASVLVPFAEKGEGEQTMRAQKLAARGLAVTLLKEECTPFTLARAMDKALAQGHSDEIERTVPGTDGAANTVKIVHRLSAEKNSKVEG